MGREKRKMSHGKWNSLERGKKTKTQKRLKVNLHWRWCTFLSSDKRGKFKECKMTNDGNKKKGRGEGTYKKERWGGSEKKINVALSNSASVLSTNRPHIETDKP